MNVCVESSPAPTSILKHKQLLVIMPGCFIADYNARRITLDVLIQFMIGFRDDLRPGPTGKK